MVALIKNLFAIAPFFTKCRKEQRVKIFCYILIMQQILEVPGFLIHPTFRGPGVTKTQKFHWRGSNVYQNNSYSAHCLVKRPQKFKQLDYFSYSVKTKSSVEGVRNLQTKLESFANNESLDISKDTHTKKKRTASKKKEENPPRYWKLDSDEVVHLKVGLEVEEKFNGTLDSSSAYSSILKFTVHGKPVPLRRHRTSRGYMYNPSGPAQRSFREVVNSILSPVQKCHKNETFFKEDDFLIMNLVFKLRRPRNHFIGNKAGPGRLRKTAPKQLFAGRVDIDNLSKFVLDSLNELVYPDDRQVVSLYATKVYDCDGECEGSTEILIRAVDDSDMDRILSGENAFT